MSVTSPFTTFISGLPAASLPLGATDYIPVVQGGASKHIIGNAFAKISGAPDYDNTTPATSGQVIAWNGSDFAPTTFVSGTIRGSSDYDNTTAPTTGQVITWNGTKYAPAASSGGGSSSTDLPILAPPSSPTTYDDEFTGSSLASKWTIQAAATGRSVTPLSAGSGFLEIYKSDGTAGMYGITQSCPTGTWTILASVFCESGFNQFNGVQLLAANSSSVIFMGQENNESVGAGLSLAHGHYDSSGSYTLSSGSDITSGGPVLALSGRFFLKMSYDGSSGYSLWVSQSGYFTTTPQLVKSTGGPSTPTSFGIAAMGFSGASAQRVLVDFFRRTA